MSLITILSDVVWLTFALGAEVLSAFVALDSVVGHMTSCLSCEEFPVVIFLSLNNLSGKKLHDVFTGALNKIRVDLNYLHSLVLLDLGNIFRLVILIQLPILNTGLTSWALNGFVFRFLLNCINSEAFNVHLMETLSGLEHRNESFLHIAVRDLLVTILAHLLLDFPLHLLIVCLGALPFSRVHEIFELHLSLDMLLLLLIWGLE